MKLNKLKKLKQVRQDIVDAIINAKLDRHRTENMLTILKTIENFGAASLEHLESEIKMEEFLHFCQTGRYPNETTR